MKKLIVPSKLNEGDTAAFISISGGRAGDADMMLGKSEYLYEHPEKRAEDLMWALKEDSVKGIICNQGGDDSCFVVHDPGASMKRFTVEAGAGRSGSGM